mgnify:CR=1 FL=1
MTKTPTIDEIRDTWRDDGETGLTVVEDAAFDKDDHGYWAKLICKRVSDETYWSVCYLNQGGGAYNSLRDDLSDDDVVRVTPVEKTIIDYKVYKE